MEPWWRPSQEQPDAAGVYALVIGVSRYAHLPARGAREPDEWTMGLSQLTSAAISAAHFARWLRTTHRLPDVSLRAIWLLLSPSDDEAPQLDGEESAAPPATSENVLRALHAWRTASQTQTANVAVLYGAGHGIATHALEPGVLLLEDYGTQREDGVLQRALNLTTVCGNMRGSPTGAPGRQFTFFDACRPRPELSLRYDLGSAPPHWDIPLVPTVETAPVFLGAATGSLAYGSPGSGTIFETALEECLDGLAVELLRGRRSTDVGAWGVADDGLHVPLRERVRQLARDGGVAQKADLIAPGGGAAIHVLAEPPIVSQRFAVAPDAARTLAFGTLRHAPNAQPVFEGLALPEPKHCEVAAGTYDFSVAVRPETPPFEDDAVSEFIRPSGPRETVVSVYTPAAVI
jgi:hypothetical protein